MIDICRLSAKVIKRKINGDFLLIVSRLQAIKKLCIFVAYFWYKSPAGIVPRRKRAGFD